MCAGWDTVYFRAQQGPYSVLVGGTDGHWVSRSNKGAALDCNVHASIHIHLDLALVISMSVAGDLLPAALPPLPPPSPSDLGHLEV